MSLLVGQTVTRVVSADPTITGPEIAVALSLFTGIIAMFIGLVRLGILVDFIPGKYTITIKINYMIKISFFFFFF